MIGRLTESLRRLWGSLVETPSPEYDPLARDLIQRLKDNNGCDLWPSDLPEGWEVAADLRWNRGVQWTGEDQECLSGLNLCQQNLSGVADFSGLPTLERLYLTDNRLAALILSDNHRLRDLHVGFNQLVRLDLAGAPALVEVDLAHNQLASLQPAPCRGLTTLYANNNRLVELDLSANPRLRRLVVYANHLTDLNISGCPELTYLSALENRLRDLDLRRNPRLETLAVGDNEELAALDLSRNGELAYLNLYNTGLTALDLSANPKLWYLVVSGNRLAELDLGRQTALSHLVVSANRLTRLEVRHLPELRTLDLADNRIEALDVSRNPGLWYLYAAANRLTEVDVRAAARLVILDVTKNRLSGLDLSRNHRLQRLYAAGNQIASLDLSHNPQLERLYVNDNPLARLELGANALTALKELDLSETRLPLSALARFVGLGAEMTMLGPQFRAFFDHLELKAPGRLDLSSETRVAGRPTAFTVLDAHQEPVGAEAARVVDGVITFQRSGRYQVLMTNPAVVSNCAGQREPATVFTGVIEVVE